MFDFRSLNPVMLADLIAAKICHDFATPLSAMGLTLEMLEDAHGHINREEIDIIRQSYAQLCKKLSILRTLFSPNNSTMLNIGDTVQVAKNLTKDQGFSFFVFSSASDHPLFDQDAPEDVKLFYGKLWMSLLLMIIESLHRGGIINIYVHAKKVQFNACAPKAGLRDSYRMVLEKEDVSLNGRNSLAIYGAVLTNSLGLEIAYEKGEGQFSIMVEMP